MFDQSRQPAARSSVPGSPFDAANTAAEKLRTDLGVGSVDVAVVCGSGLSGFVDVLGSPSGVAMGPRYGFAAPSVQGHDGRVVAGRVGPHKVLVLCGRTHLYEGHPVAAAVHGVRTAAALGATRLVLTNAAGSVNPEFVLGELVSISDHLNLTGHNPLIGVGDDHGARFVDMTAAYSPRLLDTARLIDPGMRHGVYAAFCGPSYETPAEVRMASLLGADLVGMSTVCETIAARHLGLEVAAFSVVTNLAAGFGSDLSHDDVAQVATSATTSTVEFMERFIEAL